MESIFILIKKFIPRPMFGFFSPFYHWVLAWLAAIIFLFPSRRLKVIGVTGTNGKSTVVHLITAILEEAGESVASVSSLRFRVNGAEKKNIIKMTMPGRFKLQKFLREATNKKCRYAVIEVTSEGIKQFRHLGIKFYLAALTNVTPEHIESHGTFEKYRTAKAELFKKADIHVINGEDPSVDYFLKIPAKRRIVYSKRDLPRDIHLKLLGDFNAENAVAAYHVAKILSIDHDIIKNALEKIENVPGRLEFIQKEPFAVVVDYAHTPDALFKVYQTLKSEILNLEFRNSKLICVLGAAGGGRDKWKRPEMGKIAAELCGEIILTNEDPYDENPDAILDEIENGINNPSAPHASMERAMRRVTKILDRRGAIRAALKSAKFDDAVIITGKGAEPWIMGPNGQKIPWDDCEVAREELAKII